MQRACRAVILGALVAVLAGCFPIELDVSEDGRILIARQEGFFALDTATGEVQKLHGISAGKPLFALFAANGEDIVAVTEGEGAMMGSSHTFTLVSPAARTSKVLYTASNAAYARLSPDGEWLAVSRIADQQKEPLDENMPELHIINTADGMGKAVASNVSVLHRWFPDGKSVLVFQIESKDEDGDYVGSLSAIDVVTGESKTLARAVGTRDVFFDLSPDGSKVLFTAKIAAASQAQLPAKSDEEELYLLDAGSGDVRKLRGDVSYAIWSPDGSNVLLGTDLQDGTVTLQVADAGMSRFTKIAEDAAEEAGGGFGNSANIYPVWVDDDSVAYLAMRAVYGTAAKNLELVTIHADGSGRKSLQATIDLAAGETSK